MSFRYDPWFDAVLREHLLRAARLHGYSAQDLEGVILTPEDALLFLRLLGDEHHGAYVEDASRAVNDVGWVLVDARTGRELSA